MAVIKRRKNYRFLRSAPAWGGLLLVSALLALSMLQAEFLWLPEPFEAAGRLLYRFTFWILAPWKLLVSLLLPQDGHHWPLIHWVLLCAGIPFYLWFSGWLLLRYGRRFGRWLVRRQGRYWLVGAQRDGLQPVDGPVAADPSVLTRRQFLVGAAVSGAGLATGGVGYSAVYEPERLQVRRYTLAIRDLPSELNGLRLVHLADTHFGPYVSQAYLEAAMAQANSLRPDLAVLTGDYVHRTHRSLPTGIDVLGLLRPRLGAVAVLGNHDHWEGVGRCREVFARLGVPVLDNGRLYLTAAGLRRDPMPGHSLCLAGAGDLWEDVVRLDDALGGVPAGLPRLLLSHNPDVAEMIPDAGHRVDLMLSGHTHGGQVVLPLIGPLGHVTRYGTKYLGGLCTGPACPVLVTRGVGLSGAPIRIGVPPELGLITLTAA